jgi:hypothetical protein
MEELEVRVSVCHVKRISKAMRSEDDRERKEDNVREAGRCKDKGKFETMKDCEL